MRAGEAHLVAAADHEETRRRVEAERAVVAAVGGGCLAPVAAHHDGTTLTALIAAEDGAWLERRTGDDPARARTRARVARAVRIVVTRAESQADPLVARLEALGHEVVRCPLIRIEPLGDEPIDASRLRLGRRHEPERRARARARLVGAAAPGSPRSGPATADALAAHGLHADLVPRVHTQEGLLAELPPGRVLLAAAEGARRLLVDERGADFVPLYRTVELRPPRTVGRRRAARLPRRRRARFAATGARIPVGRDRARRPRPRRAPHGLEVAAVAASHDVDGPARSRKFPLA